MGAGTNHIVLENQGSGGHLVLDLSRSFSAQPTNLFYPGPPEGQLGFDRFVAPPPVEAAHCFTPGTLIDTPRGPRPVETLAAGDAVLTIDHGFQPIQWIARRQVTDLGGRNAHLRPIRIAAGALGPGVPQVDLTVSPQHRILIRSRVAQALFGTSEILSAAKHLVAMPGIEVVEEAAEVTYIHMLLRRHELVHSNGAVTETMYPGPEALKAYGPAARARIMHLAGMDNPDKHLPKARLTPRGGQVRSLAQLHLRDHLPLVLPQPVPALAGS
ncbi:MAG: Hint domain-containing protein [Alphaproteobacteria bacterium]|nr:Hint domain-containing protein [Alphaproteobacteria bacterium]